MNILQHKSWHVFNKDNIEKVRKDEEKARKEEEAKERRRTIAEQEARTSLLRAKARERTGALPLDQPTPHDNESLASTSKEHINFFFDEERALLNAEQEAKDQAAKEEQETWEKKVGVIVGLGQSASESTGVTPFYAQRAKKYEELEISDKAEKRKDFLDPLRAFERQNNGIESRSLTGAPLPLTISAIASTDRTGKDDDKKSHKDKKRKEKKKKKDKHKPKESKDEMLKRLREERLARERAEKKRTESLLNPSSNAHTDSERGTRYHSQFNPDFARQNRSRPY